MSRVLELDVAAPRTAVLLGSGPSRRPFAYWCGGLLAAAALALLLPWQQSVQAGGELTALSPSDRPQQVPAVVGGRIEEWHVQEGQFVRRGTPLLRITEVKDAYLDPATLERYREQLVAKEAAVEAKRAKAAALAAQAEALERGLVLSLAKGRNRVAQYRAAVDAAAADSAVALDQLGRRAALQRDGLSSLNDLQGASLRAQQADAKLAERRNELRNAELELESLGAEYGEKLAKARADRSATLAEVSEGAAEVAKLRNAHDNLAARRALYRVDAPQDGYVVQALRAGIGETVKEGEAVVTIMPARPRAAAALYVKAMDVPLLRVGRAVRLQFDGWPALQFSGWPSVAVGTFGGVVAVVDQVPGADGRSRVLVTPAPDDEPWPAQLRPGSGVLGWAMLDEVRLGFEVWRRLNGFPPTVPAPAAGGGGSGT